MKRRDVWWIDFDASIGGEIQKVRPAVIVSNDAFNRKMNRLHVVPLTSNIKHFYPNQSLVTIGQKRMKAMADQLTVVSKLRVYNKIGKVGVEQMRGIETAISFQLKLSLE